MSCGCFVMLEYKKQKKQEVQRNRVYYLCSVYDIVADQQFQNTIEYVYSATTAYIYCTCLNLFFHDSDAGFGIFL